MLKKSIFYCLFLVGWASQASAFYLPDTGQTKCYQSVSPYAEIPCAGTGQDGEYDINPMSFTDNGDTITDNNTGLMWQKGDNPYVYNWYQASGTYDYYYNPTPYDVCGDLTTGNYSDWRLPTIKELVTLINYSYDVFPYHYWSSTTLAGDNYFDEAWYVDFWEGLVNIESESYYYNYVRCVRGGELDFGNFADNHDGTITDYLTGLMWQQGELGDMTWASAISYCENLELPSGSGQTDWRLPNIKELISITDFTRYNPPIDITFFPNSRGNYWSSTTDVGDEDAAWFVEVVYGRSYNHVKNNSYYMRCVRAGQSGSFGTLTVATTGSGTVTSSPAGINCGADCSEVYNLGTVVTLTPTPAAGYLFTGWRGDADCSDGSVTMNTDETCTATFTEIGAIVSSIISLILDDDQPKLTVVSAMLRR
ncbi:MAG: DUF1566 domain-containing protein [Nitrospirae bacterium]|nr:DUF1566 domain-containing protein [Nitrospirota bacterium]